MTIDKKSLFFITLLLGLMILAYVTISVHNGQWKKLDKTILSWFHTVQNNKLDQIFAALTWLGSLWLLLPASIALILGLLSYNYSFEAMMFGIGFSGATITTYLIKFLLKRERPCFFTTKGELPPDPAFPSAHTTQVFAFVMMTWLVMQNLDLTSKNYAMTILFTIAVVVTISRLYLQVHFPSDIFAGIFVSLIWAGIAQHYLKSGVLS